MISLPNPNTSRAWLTGTSNHILEPELPNLPSVANNLTDLGSVLTNPRRWGLLADNCVILLDPMRPPEVVGSLRKIATEATDTLLIYYSGHGLLGNDGSLFLALSETRSDRELLKYTALAIDDVRNAMRDSPAANKILILDCCYSGRAIAAMADTQSTIAAALEIRGAVTLTAAPATKIAISPPGERNTAFTGTLLSVLRRGIANGPELLTLDLIYEQLRSRLLADRYPLPQIQSLNIANHLALVRNGWWTSVRAGTDPMAAPATQNVPNHIRKPAYVGSTKSPKPGSPWIQDPETIDRMRLAGRIAAKALNEISREIQPGTTTDRLDEVGREFIYDMGGYPSMLGYNGFPKSICTSVNDVICNGLPDTQRLRQGDIVNIGLGVYLNGVHAKANRPYPVGAIDEESELLIAHTQVALIRAIQSIRPGRQLNIIGRAIEACAKRGGYRVVRDFTGAGIGADFINGLVVRNYDEPQIITLLELGLTFTVHPILTLGDIAYNVANDGWTVRTNDGSRCAEAQHTVVVTNTGAEILTQVR